jgi:hypothetical protein
VRLHNQVLCAAVRNPHLNAGISSRASDLSGTLVSMKHTQSWVMLRNRLWRPSNADDPATRRVTIPLGQPDEAKGAKFDPFGEQ